MIELTIPYPPSVNHLHRRVGPRTLLSREGRAYYERVTGIAGYLNLPTFKGRLALDVEVYPPDRRRRDLDNVLKAIGDALKHARLIEDDGQIDDWRVKRLEPTKDGAIILRISEI